MSTREEQIRKARDEAVEGLRTARHATYFAWTDFNGLAPVKAAFEAIDRLEALEKPRDVIEWLREWLQDNKSYIANGPYCALSTKLDELEKERAR